MASIPNPCLHDRQGARFAHVAGDKPERPRAEPLGCESAIRAAGNSMALKFHPEPGTILICDYSTGFKAPEMIKKRPVITLSPRLKRRDGLITVVPLSTSPPNPPCDYHCKLTFQPALPEPFDSGEMWVKADMLATVGFHRLELIRTGRDQYGKRKYLTKQVEPDQLRSVYLCVLHGLGMSRLTSAFD